MNSNNLPEVKVKCTSCNNNRSDKFLRVRMHDVSHLYNIEPGTLIFNFKYCSDNDICKAQSDNREEVLKLAVSMIHI